MFSQRGMATMAVSANMSEWRCLASRSREILGFYLHPNIVQIFYPVPFCSKMVSSSGMKKWMLIWSSLDIALYVHAGALLWDKDASSSVLKLKITSDQKTLRFLLQKGRLWILVCCNNDRAEVNCFTLASLFTCSLLISDLTSLQMSDAQWCSVY